MRLRKSGAAKERGSHRQELFLEILARCHDRLPDLAGHVDRDEVYGVRHTSAGADNGLGIAVPVRYDRLDPGSVGRVVSEGGARRMPRQSVSSLQEVRIAATLELDEQVTGELGR